MFFFSLQNKVASVSFYAGPAVEDLKAVNQVSEVLGILCISDLFVIFMLLVFSWPCCYKCRQNG